MLRQLNIDMADKILFEGASVRSVDVVQPFAPSTGTHRLSTAVTKHRRCPIAVLWRGSGMR